MSNSKESAVDKLKHGGETFKTRRNSGIWMDWSRHKNTLNTQIELLQFKWLTKVYITPEKLNHMSSNIPDIK